MVLEDVKKEVLNKLPKDPIIITALYRNEPPVPVVGEQQMLRKDNTLWCIDLEVCYDLTTKGSSYELPDLRRGAN